MKFAIFALCATAALANNCANDAPTCCSHTTVMIIEHNNDETACHKHGDTFVDATKSWSTDGGTTGAHCAIMDPATINDDNPACECHTYNNHPNNHQLPFTNSGTIGDRTTAAPLDGDAVDPRSVQTNEQPAAQVQTLGADQIDNLPHTVDASARLSARETALNT